MINLDTQTLRIFLKVFETQSMRIAAQELSISQAAVSADIRKLEKIIGANLFERRTRPLHPTSAGRDLSIRASEILQAAESLALIKNQRSAEKPDLSLSMIDSICHCVGPYLTPEILPLVKHVDIACGFSHSLLEKVLNDEIDIAITGGFHEATNRIQGIKLLSETFIIVAPPNFYGSINTLADLKRLSSMYPFIYLTPRCFDGVRTERILRRLDIRTSAKVRMESPGVALQLASLGKGWGMFAPFEIYAIPNNCYNVLLFRYPATSIGRSVYLLYKRPELAELAKQISASFKKVMSETILPMMERSSPILASAAALEN